MAQEDSAQAATAANQELDVIEVVVHLGRGVEYKLVLDKHKS